MATGGWNDADETIVAGSGEVYSAVLGTTAPTNESSALAPATWLGHGYHTEDGVGIAFSPDVQRFDSWQSKPPIRIERQASTMRLTFALLQWNETTLVTAFGGGTVTDLGSSHYKYTPPLDTDSLGGKAYVVDIVDGSNKGRFYIPNGVAVEGVDSQFNAQSMAGLPVTIEALAPASGGDPWAFFSNLAAFAAGS